MGLDLNRELYHFGGFIGAESLDPEGKVYEY